MSEALTDAPDTGRRLTIQLFVCQSLHERRGPPVVRVKLRKQFRRPVRLSLSRLRNLQCRRPVSRSEPFERWS